MEVKAHGNEKLGVSMSDVKEGDGHLLGSIQRFTLAEAKDEGNYSRDDNKGIYEKESSPPTSAYSSSPGRAKASLGPGPDSVSGNTGLIATAAAPRKMALGLRIVEMRMRDCVNNRELWHSTSFDDQDVDSERGVQVGVLCGCVVCLQCAAMSTAVDPVPCQILCFVCSNLPLSHAICIFFAP